MPKRKGLNRKKKKENDIKLLHGPTVMVTGTGSGLDMRHTDEDSDVQKFAAAFPAALSASVFMVLVVDLNIGVSSMRRC